MSREQEFADHVQAQLAPLGYVPCAPPRVSDDAVVVLYDLGLLVLAVAASGKEIGLANDVAKLAEDKATKFLVNVVLNLDRDRKH